MCSFTTDYLSLYCSTRVLQSLPDRLPQALFTTPRTATSTHIPFILEFDGYIDFYYLFVHSELRFGGFLLTLQVEVILITVFVHSRKLSYSTNTDLLEPAPSTITADQLFSSHLVWIKPQTDCLDMQIRKVSCGTGAQSQGSHKITRVAFCGIIQSQHMQLNRELRQSLLRVVASNTAYILFDFKSLHSNDKCLCI